MAVDLQTCNPEMEPSQEGEDANKIEAEPPQTTVPSGNEAEAAAEVVVYKKGAWSKEEDEKLKRAVEEYGVKNWVNIEKFSGLARPAKNCRLRWLNYLRPNLKKYPFTQEEENLILHLHSKYGNSWSRIASKLPGRSDNEIKNFWHKRAKKCQKHHLPIYPTIQQQENHYQANADDEYFPNYYNNNNIRSSEFQPNVVKTAFHTTDASIHSPQTLLSTDQTTPTSQTPNSLLSPRHQNSQSCQSTETPVLIQVPSLWQGGESSKVFTTLREPPALSSPQGRFSRFSRAKSPLSSPQVHSVSGSVVNTSTFLPWSPPMESPTSPLKLKLSPRVPQPYSLKMKSTQTTTDSHVASSSGLQLKSPTTAPLSPLKLRLSIPVPSKSCFQSNLSIPDSTVQLSSSTAAILPLSSPQLKQSSCSQDLSPVEPMTCDTDHIIALDPSPTKPPPVELYQPGADSCMHEVESDSSLEIMHELREAQARVRFLKKKLKQRRISEKRTLLKGSSRKEGPVSESPEITDFYNRELRAEVPLDGNSSQSLLGTSSRTKDFLGNTLRVRAPPKNAKTRDMVRRILQRKGETIGITGTGSLQVKSVVENNLSMESENSEMRTLLEESLKRGDVSRTFIGKDSMAFKEQRHSVDLYDHLNSISRVNVPKSDWWDNKQSPFHVPAGKCLNEWSTIERLFGESSTSLQESCFLKGDLFSQRSGIEEQKHLPPVHAFGPVYSQSTAITPVEPGDESGQLSYLQHDEVGYFDSLERKYTEDALMDGSLATSILCESNLLSLPHQYPSAKQHNSSQQVGKPIMEHEYLGGARFSHQISYGGSAAESSGLCESSLLLHQYPAANLLDSSSRLVGEQIMNQESPGSEKQTSGAGNSDETSNLCGSSLLMHQCPAADLIDSRYLVSLEHDGPRGEQCSLQTSGFQTGGRKTECTSSETWKQELFQEQSFMESLLVENLWPQGQMSTQDQTLLTNRFDSVVDPHAIMEAKNWNHQSNCSHTGQVLKQEQDDMSTMPEELSSLLEFFPTTIQTLEWYNNCNPIPDREASDEFDVGLGLNMSSTSQSLLTIADYL